MKRSQIASTEDAKILENLKETDNQYVKLMVERRSSNKNNIAKRISYKNRQMKQVENLKIYKIAKLKQMSICFGIKT